MALRATSLKSSTGEDLSRRGTNEGSVQLDEAGSDALQCSAVNSEQTRVRQRVRTGRGGPLPCEDARWMLLVTEKWRTMTTIVAAPVLLGEIQTAVLGKLKARWLLARVRKKRHDSGLSLCRGIGITHSPNHGEQGAGRWDSIPMRSPSRPRERRQRRWLVGPGCL
jgi:hypothetical protein